MNNIIKYILTIMIILFPLLSFAGTPLFRAGFQISDVIESEYNEKWQITGTIIDNSIYGFTVFDVNVGDTIVCENGNNEVNYYIITNIVSRSTAITCDIIWGTNNTETIDRLPNGSSPSIIGRTMKGAVAYPAIDYGNISENLFYNTKDLSIYNLGLTLSTNSGTLGPNSVGTNELKLAEVDARYVKKSGDIMTGDLTINSSLTVSNTLDSSGTLKINQMVLKDSPLQTLNTNDIIKPYSLTRIQSVSGDITLDSIEIETNQVISGTYITLIGNDNSNRINIIDKPTVSTVNGLNFTVGKDDIMKFIFDGMKWKEIYRLDK